MHLKAEVLAYFRSHSYYQPKQCTIFRAKSLKITGSLHSLSQLFLWVVDLALNQAAKPWFHQYLDPAWYHLWRLLSENV